MSNMNNLSQQVQEWNEHYRLIQLPSIKLMKRLILQLKKVLHVLVGKNKINYHYVMVI